MERGQVFAPAKPAFPTSVWVSGPGMAHRNGKTMPLAKPRYTHQLPTAKAKFCGGVSGREYIFPRGTN